MTTKLVQPLKWHGGKGAFQGKLAAWIVGLMPPRCQNPNAPAADDPGWLHYVEPFAGGLSVLLALDPDGISEVVNDLHGDLVNFWAVMAEPGLFEHFRRHVEATPFSEPAWQAAADHVGSGEAVRRAWAFFVHCRQSHAGRMKDFAAVSRNRTRGGMNEQASAWLTSVNGLQAVHERLKRVVVLGPRNALDVIEQQDGPRTLFYLDPPYLHETRATTDDYAHEMTVEQHAALLRVLTEVKGRFLLSGYRSALYDRVAAENRWTRHEFEVPNNAAGGKEKRRMTECVWTNY